MNYYGGRGAFETGLRLAVAIVGGFLVAACGDQPQAETVSALTPEQEAAAFVVEVTEAPDYKPVSAILTNRDVGAARSRIGGTLSELLVREGDEVEKGAVVGRITDQRRVLEIKAASEAVAAARARADRARSEYNRVKELFDKGVYAQARLESAQAEARGAQAQLRAAEAQRDAVQEISDQGDVLAPASGLVTLAPIPQGAVVMAGEIIAKIATGQRVLRIEIPEAEARSIQEGDEIIILANGERDKAPVLQVYPAVDNGLVVIDVEADGFDDEFVGIRTPVLAPAGSRDAILIPSRFVSTRYGVDYVRLVRSDGGILDAPVQLGDPRFAGAGEGSLEILAGLAPGDRILPFEAGQSE